MRRGKRFLSAVLCAFMVAGLTTGCGGPANTATNTGTTTSKDSTQTASDSGKAEEPLKEVVLKMYCIGDEGGVYADDVLDNLNNILKEKINATIEPLMVSWGEYKDKLPLIYASGEAYDLVYVANWCNYSAEAVKGPFLNLNDLMPEYAPQTYAEMEADGTLDTAKVNGNIYMIPSTAPDYTSHGIMWREDLRKKYNCPEITDWASLETYMDAIKENESDMLPLNLPNTAFLTYCLNYENDWARPIAGGNTSGVVTYNLTDGTELFNVVDTPEYEAFVKRQYDWAQKGYWSKSVLADTENINDKFLAGKSAITITNKGGLNTNIKQASENGLGWETAFSTFPDQGEHEKIVPTNNGVAIGVNSKNPERALMFLELMHQDEEAYNAMFYGIEGTTYVKKDGRKAFPEGVDSSTLNCRNLGMGIQVGKFVLEDIDFDKEVEKEFSAWDADAVYPALASFVIDDTNISAELAGINNVVTEYKIPLDLGVIDPETALPALKEKLKQAGIDKVMEELQKQVDEFNKTYK